MDSHSESNLLVMIEISQLTFYFLLFLFDVSVLEGDHFDDQPKMSISFFLSFFFFFLERDFYCPYKLQTYVTCCLFLMIFCSVFSRCFFRYIYPFSYRCFNIFTYKRNNVTLFDGDFYRSFGTFQLAMFLLSFFFFPTVYLKVCVATRYSLLLCYFILGN